MSEDNECAYPFRDMPVGRSRDSWPKMFFFHTCKETIREINWYRWKEAKGGEGERERTEGDDHAMDSLRYLAMTRPQPEKIRVHAPSNSFMGQLRKMQNANLGSGYPGRF